MTATTVRQGVVGRRMTEEEFLRLGNDGHKYELVDGEVREVPASHKHDIIGINIAAMIKPFAKGRGYVAGSQAGFRMVTRNIRCPDVSFMLKSRLPGGDVGEGFGDTAPDLCVEIISPSEERAEMNRKLREYFASGAQLVWHLFPDTKTATVYTSPDDATEYGPDDELSAENLLPGFRSRIADLFELD